MKFRLLTIFFVCLSLLVAIGLRMRFVTNQSILTSGAPPYGEPETAVPDNFGSLAWLKNWQRPEGPAKVGIQVGHWNSSDLPDELEKLRGNTGAAGGGKWEWEVNLAIAEALATDLKAAGVVVDILPATVPTSYWADVFIAIHADGSENTAVSGYKFAGSWRDYTQNSDRLVTLLEDKYGLATGLKKDPNISRNMRGYYAFSWWRYDHAIHPMTVGVIAETGFLTSRNDRQLLINQPEIPAKAMAEAILEFLNQESLF